jgi:CDP-4-dehydro-6-deoxyglucose reductase
VSHLITVNAGDQSFRCASQQTVLDAALSQGIVISYGCRSGLCGSCKGKLLSGDVEYGGQPPEGISGQDIERGYALFCKARPLSDLCIDIKVHPKQQALDIKTLPVRVERIDRLTADVIRLVIQLPASEPFDYIAGQWIYFLLPNGNKRAFSIANAPGKGHHLELHLRYVPGGIFTGTVLQGLKPGDLLRINGPHGTFTYEGEDQPILLVCGGTGFAPVKSILEALLGSERKAPVHLFCGSRLKSDLYQRGLISELLDDVRLSFDEVLSDESSDLWRGRRGNVHRAVLDKYLDLSTQVVYMAGPPKMIHAATGDFAKAGLNPENLFFESFEYAEASN